MIGLWERWITETHTHTQNPTHRPTKKRTSTANSQKKGKTSNNKYQIKTQTLDHNDATFLHIQRNHQTITLASICFFFYRGWIIQIDSKNLNPICIYDIYGCFLRWWVSPQSHHPKGWSILEVGFSPWVCWGFHPPSTRHLPDATHTWVPRRETNGEKTSSKWLRGEKRAVGEYGFPWCLANRCEFSCDVLFFSPFFWGGGGEDWVFGGDDKI